MNTPDAINGDEIRRELFLTSRSKDGGLRSPTKLYIGFCCLDWVPTIAFSSVWLLNMIQSSTNEKGIT